MVAASAGTSAKPATVTEVGAVALITLLGGSAATVLGGRVVMAASFGASRVRQSGTPLEGSGSALAGSGTPLEGSGSALAGSGTALAGSGTALEGSDTALAGSGTALAGSGTALAGSAVEKTVACRCSKNDSSNENAASMLFAGMTVSLHACLLAGTSTAWI